MGNWVWSNNSIANFVTGYSGQTAEGESASICRIFVDTDIRKTIVLDEMSLPFDGNEKTLENDNHYPYVRGVGYNSPLVNINGYYPGPGEILNFEIDCTGFLPTISMVIAARNAYLVTKNPPEDGDIISVFLRSTDEMLVPVRADFIITDVSMPGASYKSAIEGAIVIMGKLYIPAFCNGSRAYSYIGTSREVVRKLCGEIGIGFATNEVLNTMDKQIWVWQGYLEDFIKHIVAHSWKDPDSFYKCWIDIYYNLNFVNVNKMLMSPDEPIDITVYSAVKDYSEEYVMDKAQAHAFPKFFTNMQTYFRDSPFFIESYSTKNRSSSVTQNVGSLRKSLAYMHNQNLIAADDASKFFVDIDNAQIYDPAKLQTHIILRGRTNYDPLAGDDTAKHTPVDVEGSYNKTVYDGIQFVMSDEDKKIDDHNKWSGNVSKEFSHAYSHNLINNQELEKMVVNVQTLGLNLQVLRGEKVPVYITLGNDVESTTGTNENHEPINRMMSGTFLADGYLITYSPPEDTHVAISGFRMTYRMKHREWLPPAPVIVDKENPKEPPKASVDNHNSNAFTETPENTKKTWKQIDEQATKRNAEQTVLTNTKQNSGGSLQNYAGNTLKNKNK